MFLKFDSLQKLENYISSQVNVFPYIQEGINYLRNLGLDIGSLAYTNMQDEPNTFIILEFISIGDANSDKLEDEIRIIACTYFDYKLRLNRLNTHVLFPSEITSID